MVQRVDIILEVKVESTGISLGATKFIRVTEL